MVCCFLNENVDEVSSSVKVPEKGRKFYTSDLHFKDLKIIERCRRPFSTIEEMDRKIIDSINERCVHPDDILYILGDVSSRGTYCVDLLKEIKCKKILIIGNHDRKQLKHSSFQQCFQDVKEYDYIRDQQCELPTT